MLKFAMSKAEINSDNLLVLIVSCRKSPPERLASAQATLADLNLPLDIEIIDGFVAEDAQVDQLYDHRSNRIWVKRPLSRTEIAVYASHRMAWEHLVASGRPGALILEDDFAVSARAPFISAARNWEELLGYGRDIVKLFDFEKRRVNHVYFETRVGDLDLVKWASPNAGMVAYFIANKGAEKFLSRKRIYRQVDEDIKYFWELGLNIWSVSDNPVAEKSHELGGSLVEKSRQDAKQRKLLRSFWGNLLAVDRKSRTRFYLALEWLRRLRK
ncbi:MAG: GR25 family glycosyltransferase involved in LPS biosynthesis [Halocynthiibacter sp.]|jgi:GR25 family glycosyltransferase involved in LPS biosynthesis